MLSRDIATTLGGRFIVKEVYPFSLAEYLRKYPAPYAILNIEGGIYKLKTGLKAQNAIRQQYYQLSILLF